MQSELNKKRISELIKFTVSIIQKWEHAEERRTNIPSIDNRSFFLFRINVIKLMFSIEFACEKNYNFRFIQRENQINWWFEYKW